MCVSLRLNRFCIEHKRTTSRLMFVNECTPTDGKERERECVWRGQSKFDELLVLLRREVDPNP